MQNNYFQWQFNVCHQKTFGIINHPLSNCYDFLIEKIFTVNLESIGANQQLQAGYLKLSQFIRAPFPEFS